MPPKKKKDPQAKQRQLELKHERERKQRMDQLERELRLTEKNMAKLKDSWREMLLKMRLPMIRQDLLHMWGCFCRAMERKEYVAELLMQEWEQDEQHRCRVYEEHAGFIDRAIERMDQSLEQLHADYSNKRKDIISSNQKYLDKMKEQHVDELAYFKTTMSIMDTEKKEYALQNEVNIDTVVEELADKFSELMIDLRRKEGKRMDWLWARMKAVLKEYQLTSDERRKMYHCTQKMDVTHTRQIMDNLIHMKKLYEEINRLKVKWRGMRGSESQVFRWEATEHKKYQNMFIDLRHSVEREFKHDGHQMRQLVGLCKAAHQCLREKIKKCERLLSVAAMCRKYETQGEKITPFLPTQLEGFDYWSEKAQALAPHLDRLELFWERVGKARVSMTLLRDVRSRAQQENDSLRQNLRCLLAGVAHTAHPAVLRNRKSKLMGLLAAGGAAT